MKHWGMDRFRVRALEKLLHQEHEYNEIVSHELLKKYDLLLKGACKYDKIAEIANYSKKIDYYKKKEQLASNR
jgi:hypothetical protein